MKLKKVKNFLINISLILILSISAITALIWIIYIFSMTILPVIDAIITVNDSPAQIQTLTDGEYPWYLNILFPLQLVILFFILGLGPIILSFTVYYLAYQKNYIPSFNNKV